MIYKSKIKNIAIIILLSVLLSGWGELTGYGLPDYSCSVVYAAKEPDNDVCVIPKDDVGRNKNKGITAAGALLVDITDNRMIYADGIYDRLYPASLTKLATAIVCLKYGDMSDTVTVSRNAVNLNEPGAKICYLKEGDVINFRTLFTSFLVYSGNDAGIALAEHISGSEKKFVKLMNKELKKIGCMDTRFVNCHGLHNARHYTTVYDIYLMLNYLSENTEFLNITSMKSYTAIFKDKYGRKIKRVYESTDKYLTGEKKLPKGVSVLAGKTGTTDAAGCCLSLLTKRKSGHKYISIIMKARTKDSLYSQMNRLLKMK